VRIGARLRYLSTAVGLAAGLAALLAGTTALPAGAATTPAVPHSASHSSTAAAKSAAAPHVMYIMLENTDYSQTAGSPAMPYLSELARQYAQFPQSYGWTYPSLPNYMEFLAGSTLSPGIRAECDPGQPGCTKPLHAQTLVDQLEAAGITWHAYFQDDVSGCNDNPADFFHANYDVEHNAFAYLADFPTQCKHLSNFGPLLSNLSASRPAGKREPPATSPAPSTSTAWAAPSKPAASWLAPARSAPPATATACWPRTSTAPSAACAS